MDILIETIKEYIVDCRKEYYEDLSPTQKIILIQLYDEIALNKLKDLYDEVYDEIQYEKKIEQGLKPFVDAINGETRWRKP